MCSVWTTAEGVCPLSEMQRARDISRERDAVLSDIGQKQGLTVAILHVTTASCHLRFMLSTELNLSFAFTASSEFTLASPHQRLVELQTVFGNHALYNVLEGLPWVLS